ncbi:PAS domain-containing protein [Streptomyces sp. NBC_01218]|uniref:PAS domain-containing protein n=1 Tax=unclassified Streptomyces TaxID=2593676 RepID=UPI002E0D86D3|nr:PAS domain-containing protein [Streptomyces sp. NBC_01218]
MGPSMGSGTADASDASAASDTPAGVPAPRAGEQGPGAGLLAALLDGMDTALFALDADGTVTHWNRRAERVLGWSAAEAVGRDGFAGWAVRGADADEVRRRLMAIQDSAARQVHEFALVRKDGGRVLVRMQAAGMRGRDGGPAGVYCAFSEAHAQIDLERSIALSEALFQDGPWGVVLVDADLRPTVVNAHAARALGGGRTSLLGRPLGEVVLQGVEDLEGAFHHVLAAGAPPAPAELWVTLRSREGERRRCWRSGFLRLSSPLTEEAVPLGVAWLFQDVTEARTAEQSSARLRFRSAQLHRAARAAAECEDPWEAATTTLDFSLAGFADHALLDLVAGERLVRAAATPVDAPGPCLRVAGGSLPARYGPGHPALQSLDRIAPVRVSGGAAGGGWAADHHWPRHTAHALCVALRSRGRSIGVVTFLRTADRPAFEREDAAHAESAAVRVASAVDLALLLEGRAAG